MIEFHYMTAEDYNSTKTTHVPTSLMVTSTKNFDIDVKANGANFENGNDFIPVHVLTIKPVIGGAKPMTGYFNYSEYRSIQTNGYSGSNYQFRIGLKKYFTAATSIGNHKVSFLLFEDKNFNGILDIDETVLPNELVKLDNYVAITDQKGKVTFQNVPKGDYTLRVNESAGSRLMMDPVIVVDKNIHRNLGLVKKIKVTGKLKEMRQPYDNLETTATGILVYARNDEGHVQTAVVNQDNEFEFFLKDGVYDIYIENDKYDYKEPMKKAKVERSANADVLIFEYSKKDTTIKIKKF